MAIATTLDFGDQSDDRKKWLHKKFYKNMLTVDGQHAFHEGGNDLQRYCDYHGRADKWKGNIYYERKAEEWNASGLRSRPFRDQVRDNQIRRFDEAKRNLNCQMKALAANPGSPYNMVELDQKLMDLVSRKGPQADVGLCQLEMYKNIQLYQSIAEDNLKKMKAAADVDAALKEQSRRRGNQGLGNQYEPPKG